MTQKKIVRVDQDIYEDLKRLSIISGMTITDITEITLSQMIKRNRDLLDQYSTKIKIDFGSSDHHDHGDQDNPFTDM